MANIWVDKENGSLSTPVSSGIKFPMAKSTGRVHPTKKRAFGEIKNVMNNPQNANVYHNMKNGFTQSHVFGKVAKNLYTDVLNKQFIKTKVNSCDKSSCKPLKPIESKTEPPKAKSIYLPDAANDLFSDFDFPFKACNNKCKASNLADIWCENDLPSDDYFESVMKAVKAEDDEKEAVELPTFKEIDDHDDHGMLLHINSQASHEDMDDKISPPKLELPLFEADFEDLFDFDMKF